MSLKAGSRIRTYKPVVYKPSENAIVISDKNNDRKFMFLSEETQPDYRPIDVRQKDKYRPCPRIDHRPLGAESYNWVGISRICNTHNVNTNSVVEIILCW